MSPEEASARLRQGERAGGQALAELRRRPEPASDLGPLVAILIGMLGMALAADAQTPDRRGDDEPT